MSASVIVRSALIVATCVFVSACYTSGAYLESEEAQQVQQTITTAAQLEEALGIPSVTVPMEGGKTMWIYQGIHKRANAVTFLPYIGLIAGGNDKKCTRVTVLVDKDGQLSDWNYTAESGSEHWMRTNDKCTPVEKKKKEVAKQTG